MSDWTWSDELDRYTYGIIRDNYDVTYENNINVGEAIVRIVTHDIPSNVIAAGVPARILREI